MYLPFLYPHEFSHKGFEMKDVLLQTELAYSLHPGVIQD